jgi:hypothetical protein
MDGPRRLLRRSNGGKRQCQPEYSHVSMNIN